MLNLSDSFLAENQFSCSVIQAKILSIQDCENIISYCQNYPEEPAAVADPKSSDIQLRKSSIRWIGENHDTKKIYDLLRKTILEINSAHWRLDLTGFTEPLQFTHYKADGNHYGWHMDSGNGRLSLRKLSVVIQLSDPDAYEGGDLQVQSVGRVFADRTQGTAILFPSHMQHRVTPVVKGDRYSLVSWISGPPLR